MRLQSQIPKVAESLDGQGISEAISAKQSTLSEISRESSVLHQRIMRLTAPLERPSKKFDHIAQNKKGLNQFIKDPIGSLNSESDYGILMSLINEMADKLGVRGYRDKGCRQGEGIGSRAGKCGHLWHGRRVQATAAEGLSHARGNKIARKQSCKVQGGNEQFERASESKESMRRRAAEIGAKLEATKAEIERLFLAYYGKRISIIIGQ